MIRRCTLTPTQPRLPGTYQPGDTIMASVNAADAAFTISLPDAKTLDNVTIYIKKIDTTINAVTILAPNNQTIDGDASATITYENDSEILMSDRSNFKRFGSISYGAGNHRHYQIYNRSLSTVAAFTDAYGNLKIGTTTAPQRKLHVEVEDANDNSTVYAARFGHVTTEYPLNNLGVGLEFEIETVGCYGPTTQIGTVQYNKYGFIFSDLAKFDAGINLDVQRIYMGDHAFIQADADAKIYQYTEGGLRLYGAGIADYAGSGYANIMVRDSSGWIYTRTKAELLSDIGAAASGHKHYQLYDSTLTNVALYTDTSGYVGIGGAPVTRLTVEGAGVANENVLRVNNQGNFASRLWMRNANQSAYMTVSPTTAPDSIATDLLAGSLALGLSNAYPIQFFNGNPPSVKMTIYSDGTVGVNTGSSAPAARFAVEGNSSAHENVLRINNQADYAARLWVRNINRSAYFGVSSSNPDDIATGITAYSLGIGIGGDPSPIHFYNGNPKTVKLTIATDGTLNFATCADAGADVDKFLVYDLTGNIDYRTGAEVLSDIGAAPAAHGVSTGYIPRASSSTAWADSPMSVSLAQVNVVGATVSSTRTQLLVGSESSVSHALPTQLTVITGGVASEYGIEIRNNVNRDAASGSFNLWGSADGHYCAYQARNLPSSVTPCVEYEVSSAADGNTVLKLLQYSSNDISQYYYGTTKTAWFTYDGLIGCNATLANGAGRVGFYSAGTRFGAIACSDWWAGGGGTDLSICADSSKAIRFYTGGSGTIRAFIKSTGEMSVGHMAPLATFDVSGTARLGDSTTNYSSFEADGTLVFVGNATVYEDIQFPITVGKVPGANAPTWETFTTNTSEYSFTVNDYIDTQAGEPPHGWAEGTIWDVHLHVTIKTAQSSGANRYAKYTVYIGYCDVTGVWTETSLTAELTIPTGAAALTQYYLDMGDVTPTGVHIGSQIKARIKRIAATGGTEYAYNTFITQCGAHCIKNKVGSRTETGA